VSKETSVGDAKKKGEKKKRNAQEVNPKLIPINLGVARELSPKPEEDGGSKSEFQAHRAQEINPKQTHHICSRSESQARLAFNMTQEMNPKSNSSRSRTSSCQRCTPGNTGRSL